MSELSFLMGALYKMKRTVTVLFLQFGRSDHFMLEAGILQQKILKICRMGLFIRI